MWRAAQGDISPADIPNLEWWIDSSDLTTITIVTNRIAQWDDKSGNDKHLTRPATSSASRPVLETNSNGKTVVKFEGNQSMDVGSSADLFNFMHQTNVTVFTVAKYGTNAVPNAAYTLLNNNQANAGIGFGLTYDSRSSLGRTNSPLIAVTRAGSSFVIVALTNNTMSANAFVMHTYKLQPGAATALRAEYQENKNTSHFPNTGTQAINAGNAAANLNLGRTSSGTLFLIGDVCEILIYREILSENDTGRIQTYLINKWGL